MIREFPVRNGVFENFMTLWNFKAGKSTSELRFWIKEVEIADFNMIDAMIVSALKKLLNTQTHFRKRVSVEEQRAQEHDRFSRGRQIAYMIYEYFRATGALKKYKDSQICSL